jgi:hypothetical protein
MHTGPASAVLAEQGPPTNAMARHSYGQPEGRTPPKRLARIAGVLYLLVIGVKTPKPDERIPVPGFHQFRW